MAGMEYVLTPLGNSRGYKKKEVRRLMDIVVKDGGLIAAPAHAITGDAKPENVMAMIEVLHSQQ